MMKRRTWSKYICVLLLIFSFSLYCKGGWYGTVPSVIAIVFHAFWRDFDSVSCLRKNAVRNLEITDDEKENMVKVCLCVAFDIQLFLYCKGGNGTVSSGCHDIDR
jgi:hypothetical protein